MKRANDFLVGLSVIVVALSVTGATLWIKQSDIGEHRSRVVARFRDVGNARVGNSAVIRGVRAGRIEAIELATDGWVQLRMSIDPSVRLPQDPVVLLNESSLFGDWQATITERAALPNNESVIRQVREAEGGGAVIPGATLPDIAKLSAVAGQIAGDVASVAGRVEVAFDDAAARELRTSIRNFATLSSTLATTVRAHEDDLDSLSTQLQAAARSLNRTATTTRRMADHMDSSVSAGQVKQIVDDVAHAAAELRATSLDVHDLARQLGRSQGRLDSFLANSDSLVVKINRGQGSLGLLVNDASLYRNGDSLLVQLRALVNDVQMNPKKYLNVSIF